MILVDSNVILDVVEQDHRWHDWSMERLEDAARSGRVGISAVVVGEVAPRFGSLSAFMGAMSDVMIAAEPLTSEAAYLAGVAFGRYRGQGRQGQAKSLLADFLIGGHAASLDAVLLTRDPRFYRSYFPDLSLITPETHP